MDQRLLGDFGLEVSALVFGGNVFGWTVDQPRAFSLLDRFYAAGGNFIDTADYYSVWVPGNQGGESELIIGNWMRARGNRHKIIVATKVGLEVAPGEKGLSKKHIIRAIEASLHRLQTDYIDLYQAHQDDLDTPLDETLAAFTTLIQQGKVRMIGASNYKANRIEEALDIAKEYGFSRYQTLQAWYNLYDRADFESKLEPVCVKNGLGVLTYYSLAGGFLSGKYRSPNDLSKSERGKHVEKYFTEKGKRILTALDAIAAQYHVQPAEVALAWLLARPSVTAVIASATTLTELEDLISATTLRLDHAAMARLSEASHEFSQ